MLRWNLVLVILAILLALDAVLIMTRDINYSTTREALLRDAGIVPRPGAKHHVHSGKKMASMENVATDHSEDHAPDATDQTDDVEGTEGKDSDEKGGDKSAEGHKIAGLNCEAYGGPSNEDAAEMVYWQDIPSDSKHVSPLKSTGPEPQYLTFEPDEGGWNNIRMAMETAVTLAHAMGRILVMPPEQGMYLLHKDEKNQKNRFSFSDFFHFDSVAAEHAGVEVITMQEFLEREVMTGHMIDKKTKQVTFPPGNRTNWDGVPRHEAKQLDQWLRTFTNNPIWPFDECVTGIPAKPGPEGPEFLKNQWREVNQVPFGTRRKKFTGNPVPVDATPNLRLAEMYGHRQRICIYDEAHQKAKVIHMMGDNASGARLLVHFYAYLFFEDWRHDVWTKRFVRDHLRYVDEIQCAAARVVTEMRKKSKENGHGGIFDTLHIRRGDFQYKDTRVDADVIYNNIKDVLVEGSTIYIATDERDKQFFKLFHQHYKVYFLDDFMHVLSDVNTNFFGMLDQRVASRGRTFVGTFYSTFTGYINRMRGYHSQKDKAEGWEQGIINSYFDIPLHTKFDMREYRPIVPAMWAREFPIAWRDIDKGITDLR